MGDFWNWLATLEGAVVWTAGVYLIGIVGLILIERH